MQGPHSAVLEQPFALRSRGRGSGRGPPTFADSLEDFSERPLTPVSSAEPGAWSGAWVSAAWERALP